MELGRKRWNAVGVMAVFLTLFLSGCGWAQAGLNQLDGVAAMLGSSQITKENDLIGERTYEDQPFTGDYKSQCEQESGRDVIFGGGSVFERTIRLTGWIRTDAGSAKVRVRMNGEVLYPAVAEDGTVDLVLSMKGGGNYIMVDYDGFSGNVKLSATAEGVIAS